MRFVLFFATLGVLTQGAKLDPNNPAASVFQFAAGEVGLRIFGVVLWSAAISSVIGASYTSISFLKTLHPFFLKHERLCISIFIVLSACVFALIGKPVKLLIAAGIINGFILPFALGVVLVACTKKRLMNGYNHPVWMQTVGWVVVAIMGSMSLMAVWKL
jgi:Mn2+/Fe2+ NRAMP family transporter